MSDISLNIVAAYYQRDFRKETAYNTLLNLGYSAMHGISAAGVGVGVLVNSGLYGLGYGAGSLVNYLSESTHEPESPKTL